MKRLAILLVFPFSVLAQDSMDAALARGEWPAYAGTYAAARYSPLDQINASNASQLKIAWRWKSPDAVLRAAKLQPRAELRVRGDAADAERRALHDHFAFAGRGDRRDDGRNEVGYVAFPVGRSNVPEELVALVQP